MAATNIVANYSAGYVSTSNSGEQGCFSIIYVDGSSVSMTAQTYLDSTYGTPYLPQTVGYTAVLGAGSHTVVIRHWLRQKSETDAPPWWGA